MFIDLSRSVLVLQLPPSVDRDALVDLVVDTAATARDEWSDDDVVVFVGTHQVHWSALTTWLALTDNAPDVLVDALQALVQEKGAPVELELAIASRLDLLPDLRLSKADGLEFLVPDALAGSGERTLERAGLALFIRRYVFKRPRPAIHPPLTLSSALTPANFWMRSASSVCRG